MLSHRLSDSSKKNEFLSPSLHNSGLGQMEKLSTMQGPSHLISFQLPLPSGDRHLGYTAHISGLFADSFPGEPSFTANMESHRVPSLPNP